MQDGANGREHHKALEITRETESQRALAELRRVIASLGPWGRSPMVQDLAEAVAEV